MAADDKEKDKEKDKKKKKDGEEGEEEEKEEKPKLHIDMNKVIEWFERHEGKLTYSMSGSRNGKDGTADCSGGISQALIEAGSKIGQLHSTVSLGPALLKDGFEKISTDKNWDAQRGDIVLMTAASSMAGSAGAAGHVGIMKSADTFISVDFHTQGQSGTAVSTHKWKDYHAYKAYPTFEIYRLTGYGGDGSSSGGSLSGAAAALFGLISKIMGRRRESNVGREFSRADVDALDIKTDAARNLYELFEGDPEYTPSSVGLNALGVTAGAMAARSGTKLALDVAAYGDDGLRIMGMPLRFSPLDDPSSRVFNNTFESDLPVVFIQPGKPKVNKKLFGSAAEGGWLSLGNPFFNKVGNAVTRTVGEVIPGGTAVFGDFRDNRYMSFQSTFSEYEAYVNAMLVQLHATMGLGGMFSLTNFTNSDKYGLAFYSSRGTSISESANNDYSMAEIGREANDKQSQIREKKLAADTGGADVISMLANWWGDIMKAAADIPVIGGIIGSLTQNLDGSMLYYPDKWDNSTFDRSYSVEFKFYSPYGDAESIFYYVYMPFICVLGLGLPLQDSYYSYSQPFIVKMSSPGFFECEMGVIRSMSFERGTDNTWTAEGLPREITIRLTVTDMYPQMMLSKSAGHMKYNYGLASYIDCMAGIRYDQLSFLDKVGKKIKIGANRAVSVLTLRRPRLWFGDRLNDLGSYVDWKVTR